MLSSYGSDSVSRDGAIHAASAGVERPWGSIGHAPCSVRCPTTNTCATSHRFTVANGVRRPGLRPAPSRVCCSSSDGPAARMRCRGCVFLVRLRDAARFARAPSAPTRRSRSQQPRGLSIGTPEAPPLAARTGLLSRTPAGFVDARRWDDATLAAPARILRLALLRRLLAARSVGQALRRRLLGGSKDPEHLEPPRVSRTLPRRAGHEPRNLPLEVGARAATATDYAHRWPYVRSARPSARTPVAPARTVAIRTAVPSRARATPRLQHAAATRASARRAKVRWPSPQVPEDSQCATGAAGRARRRRSRCQVKWRRPWRFHKLYKHTVSWHPCASKTFSRTTPRRSCACPPGSAPTSAKSANCLSCQATTRSRLARIDGPSGAGRPARSSTTASVLSKSCDRRHRPDDSTSRRDPTAADHQPSAPWASAGHSKIYCVAQRLVDNSARSPRIRCWSGLITSGGCHCQLVYRLSILLRSATSCAHRVSRSISPPACTGRARIAFACSACRTCCSHGTSATCSMRSISALYWLQCACAQNVEPL